MHATSYLRTKENIFGEVSFTHRSVVLSYFVIHFLAMKVTKGLRFINYLLPPPYIIISKVQVSIKDITLHVGAGPADLPVNHIDD